MSLDLTQKPAGSVHRAVIYGRADDAFVAISLPGAESTQKGVI